MGREESTSVRVWSAERLVRDAATRRLEAAELAADDLDAQVVAGCTDLRQRDSEILGDPERLLAGQAFLFAGALLERLDESWSSARGHARIVPKVTVATPERDLPT